MSYWKIWLFTGYATGGCVHDIHWGECFAWTPVLITYNGIHAQVQRGEWGSGGSTPRKIFASHPLQIAREHLLSFVI